jgi:O-antigen ligase
LAFVCILVTFSRASWIGWGFLVLISGILYGRTLVWLDLIALLPGALLLVFTSTIPPKTLMVQQQATSVIQGQTNTLSMVGERVGSTPQIRSRILTGYAGLRMFAEKPIWGWGYQTYDLHAKKFLKPVGSLKITKYDERATSHNTFITILAETGVLGLFLYTFPLAWWTFLAVRNRHVYMASLYSNSFMNSSFFMILWANLAFILIISHAMDIRFFHFTQVQVWLILGLISNLIQPDSDS